MQGPGGPQGLQAAIPSLHPSATRGHHPRPPLPSGWERGPAAISRTPRSIPSLSPRTHRRPRHAAQHGSAPGRRRPPQGHRRHRAPPPRSANKGRGRYAAILVRGEAGSAILGKGTTPLSGERAQAEWRGGSPVAGYPLGALARRLVRTRLPPHPLSRQRHNWRSGGRSVGQPARQTAGQPGCACPAQRWPPAASASGVRGES